MDRTAEYLTSLSRKETMAFSIAKEQLGSSFCLIKSLGYLAWLEKNPTSIYDEDEKTVTTKKKKKKRRIKKKANVKITSGSTNRERGGGDAAKTSH